MSSLTQVSKTYNKIFSAFLWKTLTITTDKSTTKGGMQYTNLPMSCLDYVRHLGFRSTGSDDPCCTRICSHLHCSYGSWPLVNEEGDSVELGVTRSTWTRETHIDAVVKKAQHVLLRLEEGQLSSFRYEIAFRVEFIHVEFIPSVSYRCR